MATYTNHVNSNTHTRILPCVLLSSTELAGGNKVENESFSDVHLMDFDTTESPQTEDCSLEVSFVFDKCKYSKTCKQRPLLMHLKSGLCREVAFAYI